MKFTLPVPILRWLFIKFCDDVIDFLGEHDDTLTARKLIRNEQLRARSCVM